MVVATIDGDLSEGEVLGAFSIGNSLGFDQSWGLGSATAQPGSSMVPGDDSIYGGDADQMIHTLGGDDTVYGYGGYDIVVMEGSAGSLSYTVTPGTDQIVVATDSAQVSATGVEEFRIDGGVYEVIDGDLVASTAAPVLTDPGLVVELADGLEDVPYQVSVTDLVSGYSDPEGTELSVSNLTRPRERSPTMVTGPTRLIRIRTQWFCDTFLRCGRWRWWLWQRPRLSLGRCQ